MPLLPTIEEEGSLPWLRLIWRYRLQFQSMAAASVVFVGSGMRLAWSIFDTPAGKFLDNNNTHHLMMSWYLGAALGALLAAFCVQRVSKNVAYTSSGLLLLIAGVLNCALPRDFGAACWSSVGVGAAFGLSQVQALVTGAEVAHKSIRGLLLSCERISLWLGVCLELLYTRCWYALEPAERGHELHIDQLHGLLLAAMGVAAVLLALAHRFESPLLLLRQQRSDAAVSETLKQLNGSSQAPSELLRLREDYRQLSVEDYEREAPPGCWQRCWRRLRPLVLVLLLRCFAALPLSLPFNRAFLVVSWHGFECDMNCLYLLAFCGLLGSLSGALLVDWQGRRKLCWLSLFVAGIVIFLVAGVFDHLEATKKTYYELNPQVIALLMLLFELLMSMGVAVPALVYSAEAFSVAAKAPSLAGILICEQTLQLGFLALLFADSLTNSVFFFVYSALSFALGVLVFMCMPETRQLPLYDCLLKFKKVP